MTPQTQQSETLTLKRTIGATPQEVFDAWTRPEHMARWSCPDPGADVEVEVDLRVGGSYCLKMGVEGGPATARGTYKVIEAPHRLVYTWDWDEASHRMDVETVVTVEFTAVDGGTEVRLTHEGFPAAEAKQGHDEGWVLCLDRLEALFA